MKTTSSALFGLAMLASSSMAHMAIMPPMPDRALTPNSTVAPPGCKLLPSDKGWPADEVWKKTFPGVYKKLKGTVGPDWMFQVKTVEDVQKGVNFAREHNVRLTVISTGHDFIGRETARSGLRLDMFSMREPTVFSNEWKCGDTLKPTTKEGVVVDEVLSCQVPKNKKNKLSEIAGRDHEFHFFEKRDGYDCDKMMKLKKRQMEGMEGMGHGHPSSVPTHNKITPIPGKQAYARVSGGMYNEMFYTQAADSGLMTLGAQHGGVSVTGGWMQGGGHNPFSHKFGLQVDNVVEIEVVTPDGKFQKVSDCNNPELFWALRGGGGSTFGVVTGLTVKVFPTFPITVSRFYVNSTSKAGILDATAWFLQNGAKLRDEYGLQGYFYVYRNSFHSVLHMPDDFAKLENAKKATEHVMKKMEELSGSKSRIEPKLYQYKNYFDWYTAEMGNEEMEEKGEYYLSFYDGSDGTGPSSMQAFENPMRVIPWYFRDPQYPEKRKRSVEGEQAPMQDASIMRSQPDPRHYLDSRLLSNEHCNSVPLKTLADAINGSMPDIDNIHWRGFLYGGGKQFEFHPDSVGVTPAWRNATWHFIINAVPGMIRHDYNVQSLAKLFPDAGAYVNEASHEDPEWKRVFWGDHYPKLEAIKKKVDPKNVFWCSPCISADVFTYDDERICPNPKYPEAGPPPQTFPNRLTKTGINSLPGELGIPHPLIPIITDWQIEDKLPTKMLKSNYFKIAMGEGGSAGGKFKDMDPYHPGQKLAHGWGQ